MEKITFDNVVGFVLAFAFAIVMGVSLQGAVVGDYMQLRVDVPEQTQQTLRVIGVAGALAALAAWWVQHYAGERGFLVRMLFALFVFSVAFVSLGSVLRVVFSQWAHPSILNWSLSDFYWVPYDNLITFVVFMIRPAVGLLALTAGIYLAIFGPRAPRTITA
jgi:ABC-type Fe3+-siderophore transport system permease subunit